MKSVFPEAEDSKDYLKVANFNFFFLFSFDCVGTRRFLYRIFKMIFYKKGEGQNSR